MTRWGCRFMGTAPAEDRHELRAEWRLDTCATFSRWEAEHVLRSFTEALEKAVVHEGPPGTLGADMPPTVRR